MKVLIVGKGGREHAILRTIKKFNENVDLFCAPGNAGTGIDATNVNISELNSEEIKSFSIKNKIDFVIVAPDNPLAEGMVDVLNSAKIPCFGPLKQAAKIESSKIYAKNLMRKYGIATADYEAFSSPTEALTYIKTKNQFPIVIKADGLAFGKGVFIVNNLNQAETVIENLMIKKQLQKSAEKIVIEEFMKGTEVSVLCLTDGETIKPLVSSLDHKKAFDGDRGPNTGGMGAVAPNFAYDVNMAKMCMDKIFIPTIQALNEENNPFCGCLYFGLMLTEQGPKVVEYNCRFGDPETQAILPLLKTNLLDLLIATSNKTLKNFEIEFSNETTACVVLASKGYPEKFETGFEISGLNSNGQLQAQNFAQDIQIFHSGTKLENNKFKTCSGRVLSVVAKNPNLQQAIKTAYMAAQTIDFENKFLRSDIGAANLKLLSSF